MISGGEVTFTITVTNTGDVDLVSVAVSDPQASSCNSNIGNLAAGASTSYDCTVSGVTEDFTNVATVTGQDPQGNEVSDNDDASVDVISPTIDIVKTPDQQTVISGGDVTFTITVTNTGDVDLVSVAVSDPQASSCNSNIGNLAAGASTSYDCTLSNVTADLVNVATVTGQDPQGNPVTAEDDASVDVISPTINIAKSPDSQTVISGGDVTFTVTVTNGGDVDLTNVTVSMWRRSPVKIRKAIR